MFFPGPAKFGSKSSMGNFISTRETFAELKITMRQQELLIKEFILKVLLTEQVKSIFWVKMIQRVLILKNYPALIIERIRQKLQNALQTPAVNQQIRWRMIRINRGFKEEDTY